MTIPLYTHPIITTKKRNVNMHFSSIELYNYGIYKGHHVLHLTDQIGDKNITLIGGMNGRGKTTLLDSVFLCLYGRKSIEFITGKRTAYHKVLKDRINKSSIDKNTYIRLTMEMDDEDNTTIKVSRSWSQHNEKIDTLLSVEKNGIKDKYLSDNWEYYVEELVPFGIARFFFFDNEKISQIADDDAFDKIKDSIKSVIGVTTVESLCNHIEKIRKEKTEIIKTSDSSILTQESNILTNELEDCEARLRILHSQKASLVPELEKSKDRLELAEQDFWSKGGNLSFNRDDIIRDQRTLKEKAESLKEEALLVASNPATPLCLCKNLINATYNRIKTDEQMMAKHYSLPIITQMYNSLLSDFSKTVSESKKSVDTLRDLITMQLVNLEKEVLKVPSNTLTPLAQSLLEKFVDPESQEIIHKAKSIVKENTVVTNSIAQLEVHLSSSAEKNETIDLFNRIKELQALITKKESDIAKIEESIHSTNNEKEQLERKKNKLMIKIASAADTSDGNLRVIEYSTMTLEIMREFVNRLQAQKVIQLEQNIASCFRFLAQKEGIITSFSIDPVSLDITLKDYNGGILLKDQLSAGEKQMFAISILWGLALSSGYKLPVIIDTPMARLDSAHRSNFINKYLPNASSQVIVLSTDEEIYGSYLEDIAHHVNTTYTLVYNANDKCSSICPGYFGGTFS